MVKNIMYIHLKLFVMWLGLLIVGSAYATGNLYSTDALQLMVQQPQANKLECNYRLVKIIPVNHVEAKLGDIVLPVLNNTPFPEIAAQSAILYVSSFIIHHSPLCCVIKTIARYYLILGRRVMMLVVIVVVSTEAQIIEYYGAQS